ncbi:hypothetical protein PHYSODRAFT_296715 [Phytophthora sojae]|uniref:Uncharacterized protein n=1 Tax=Phytophthora sojae (strain P6497) TaxID=1094619 RepID=G4YS37_PHYSP|nr:hypothetical protein PHYSODRAFT_296715 [Phytophthora sojae]EGZ24738.1 hypothetical protein PHYSODRAFT_296715 [Phytophthora sojae]|eukprot:XP_009520026.1 hypothetical protein PHYSODRAFT_296715 [Phytophthora sojae]
MSAECMTGRSSVNALTVAFVLRSDCTCDGGAIRLVLRVARWLGIASACTRELLVTAHTTPTTPPPATLSAVLTIKEDKPFGTSRTSYMTPHSIELVVDDGYLGF